MQSSSNSRPPSTTSPRIAPQDCVGSRQFIRRVAARGGVTNDASFAAAVTTILGALARRLRPVDAAAVAGHLPPALAVLFEVQSNRAQLAGVTREQPDVIAMGYPKGHVRAVCQVLAESLDEQARAHLRIQPIADLFRSAA